MYHDNCQVWCYSSCTEMIETRKMRLNSKISILSACGGVRDCLLMLFQFLRMIILIRKIERRFRPNISSSYVSNITQALAAKYDFTLINNIIIYIHASYTVYLAAHPCNNNNPFMVCVTYGLYIHDVQSSSTMFCFFKTKRLLSRQ